MFNTWRTFPLVLSHPTRNSRIIPSFSARQPIRNIFTKGRADLLKNAERGKSKPAERHVVFVKQRRGASLSASHAIDIEPDDGIELTHKTTRFNLARSSRRVWILIHGFVSRWERLRAPTGRNFAATLSAPGLTIALTLKKFNDRV